MSLQVLASETQNPIIAASDVKQPSAKFAPCIWSDHFLSYAASSKDVDIKLKQHHQELKEDVIRMLMAPVTKPSNSQKMDIIDKIQRLRISYHFEIEINEILKQIHNSTFLWYEDREGDGNLDNTALRFRSLRQQGYNASCTLFDKFKDSKGTCKEYLVTDVAGLLSLYEATHLRTHGEDLLDEALSFTTTHLESVAQGSCLSSSLSKQVTHALYQPLWKGFLRIEARHDMSVYEEEDSHNETLLTFAKLDFNLVQKIHQKELSDMTRWWKDFNFANKIPFARHRIVESYLWAAATFFEPEYEFVRMITCKYVNLTVTLDDLYDSYGTYEQLELFTEAIERLVCTNLVDKLARVE